jgi:predicted MFS family arabinose efflux permease
MRESSDLNEEKIQHGRLFLPSLFISYFAVGPLAVVVALFLIDMGSAFNVSVGVMGQINTLYSIAATIFALLMGVLSVRFKHKSLLLIGLCFILISALGCFLAPDFNIMFVSYSLSGVGWAVVSPMVVTLIGEHYPLEKRGNAIGWIVAGGALSYVIGPPLIALVAGFGGWRIAVLGFVIPVSLVSILLALLGLPSTSVSQQGAKQEDYLNSFKTILANKSAIACLAGDALRSAAFIAIVIYVASFVRQRFFVSTDFASIVLLIGASCYAIGGLLGGRFINQLGRKRSTVLTALLSGIFTISYACATNLWLSLALVFAGSWFFGMVASAANSLTLEQVPKFRGTMMSLDSAALNMGSAVGTAVGGLILLSFDYEGLGVALGAIGIVAAVVFYSLAKDPTGT